jgi:flagellar basal body-associated protein FliL
MRRRLFPIIVLAVLATPALAQEGAPAAVGQYVDVSPVAVPVVDGGRLRNYVFVNLRLTLARGVDNQKLRAKEPYFRDALVRTSHRTPFTIPGNWSAIDQQALRNAMWRQATAIAGPGVITNVLITQATPQRRLAAPHR